MSKDMYGLTLDKIKAKITSKGNVYITIEQGFSSYWRTDCYGDLDVHLTPDQAEILRDVLDAAIREVEQ